MSRKASENGPAYVRSDSGQFLSPGSRFGYKLLCHDLNSTNWKILKAYFYLDYRCRGGVVVAILAHSVAILARSHRGVPSLRLSQNPFVNGASL